MAFNPDDHRFHSPQFQSVVAQAVQFFMATPLQPLPPSESFAGAGVYGLYLLYHDSFYQALADTASIRPIYVGKAVPFGWRTGRTQTDLQIQALYQRLREHSRTINQVSNLALSQFQVRFILLQEVESDLIAPVEAALIRHYTPLWNAVIDGFGNHDPGLGRYHQAVSEWDILHPGRPWVAKLVGEKPNLADILAKVKAYSPPD